MTTKLGALQVAEDNAAMGLDMLATANGTLDQISEKLQRLRNLAVQASNGTYGSKSKQAINAEANALVDEIERLYNTAEYNGVKFFEAPIVAQEPVEQPPQPDKIGIQQLNEQEAIAAGYTIIRTADDLQAMKDNLTGKYILVNDIDLSGYSWTTVGTSNPFEGELNGNGYEISHLNVVSTGSHAGLFGETDTATLVNIALVDVNVEGSGTYVGALVGETNSVTRVDNCYSTGIVNGGSYTGGLIGRATSYTQLTDCYSTCNVSGGYTGGLVGYSANSNIDRCYATGDVSGSHAGGLVGYCDRYVYINYCFATGTSSEDGFVGYLRSGSSGSSVSMCYSVQYDANTTSVTEEQLVQKYGLLGFTSSSYGWQVVDGLPKHRFWTNPLPIAPPEPITTRTLQIGTNADDSSSIALSLMISFDNLDLYRQIGTDTTKDYLMELDNILMEVSAKQTEYGAAENRLESALEDIFVKYDNLVSSRSTLRDADIADISSEYIKQQILQQASATLLSTANQSASIALSLI